MTRMLDQLGAELDAVDAAASTLIGSSLGGTLAILAADRFARADRSPGAAGAGGDVRASRDIICCRRSASRSGGGAARCRFSTTRYGEERPLTFAFYEDSLRYDAFDATFAQPTLIFQGLRDASVDYRTVEQFAQARPNVTLSLLDDDHQLIASLPRIWNDVGAHFWARRLTRDRGSALRRS